MAEPINITLPSPAKLNLFLHICGQREDGYHNLQTLFQILDTGDELTFSPRKDNTINITPEIEGLAVEDNLIYKAAKILAPYANTPAGVDIELVKNMPMGGGIGGGSSNAATTFVALNYLWDCQLSDEKLKEFGADLGADIPIFIHGKTAWAEGVGDKLESIQLPEDWFLVIAPDAHVPTAKIFSHKELTRDSKIMRMRTVLEQSTHHEFVLATDAVRNDCEPLVKKLYPEVDKALSWLAKYAPSQMTGTGACIFAKFANKRDALEVFAKLPVNLKGFVAQGKNTSPLQLAMQDFLLK